MNKQELIGKYEYLNHNFFRRVDTSEVLRDLKQLDEPEKVKIPQFVADWIEKSRLKGWDLLSSMCFTLNDKDKKTIKWLHLGENVNIFAHAWLDGYEVEKEKRYRISMPKARNHKNHAQFLCEQDEKIFWCGEWYPFKTEFTRKELEQDNFGWVFDCEGVEIEEVE